MSTAIEQPRNAQENLDPTLGGIRGFLQLVVRFVPLALPYWDKLLLRVVVLEAKSVVEVLGALAAGKVVDTLAGGDSLDFLEWATLALAMSLASLIFLLCWATSTLYVRMRLDLKLKRMIFDHLQRMSLAFHQSRPIGENMYRINNDSTAATDITISTLPEIFERLIPILTTAGLLFALNPSLVVLISVYITIHYVFSHVLTGYGYRFQTQLRRRQQDVSAILQEGLSGYPISKAMSRERHELRRYYGRLKEFLRAWLACYIVENSWAHGTIVLHETVRQVVYILFCGALVIAGKMTVGDYVALQGLIWLVMVPLIQLVYTIQRFRLACVPAQRMLETLDRVPEIRDKENPVILRNSIGAIAFEEVYFRYQPDGPDVIKNLSFSLEPGKKLAIVGVSGAGKSSIFNLLMRFSDPHQGRVLIDGVDLRDIRLDSYLAHVAIVLQDNFLFSATFRDNILMGNIHATDQQLEYAIECAGLGATLEEMPNGLDSVLLEGGDLSNGQKQRLAIARAVIRDPRFLYLDEATSALDPVTEELVLKQMAKVEEGRTTIVIAHHIASVRDADEIIVMENGLCVQRGCHEALIAREGPFRQLWAAEQEKPEGGVPLAIGEASS